MLVQIIRWVRVLDRRRGVSGIHQLGSWLDRGRHHATDGERSLFAHGHLVDQAAQPINRVAALKHRGGLVDPRGQQVGHGHLSRSRGPMVGDKHLPCDLLTCGDGARTRLDGFQIGRMVDGRGVEGSIVGAERIRRRGFGPHGIDQTERIGAGVDVCAELDRAALPGTQRSKPCALKLCPDGRTRSGAIGHRACCILQPGRQFVDDGDVTSVGRTVIADRQRPDALLTRRDRVRPFLRDAQVGRGTSDELGGRLVVTGVGIGRR